MGKKKSVASASKKPKKRAQKAMDTNVVADYWKRLEASLGDDEKFMDVFGELKIDSRVTQAEAIAIGSSFVAPMPKSTPKGKALERILKRHKNILVFKLKQRAVGGRSAA